MTFKVDLINLNATVTDACPAYFLHTATHISQQSEHKHRQLHSALHVKVLELKSHIKLYLK